MKQICGWMVRMLLLLFAVGLAAQQNNAVPGTHSMPTVEDHVKMLAERLDLTADQQAKITPAIRQMQATAAKLHEDNSLSQDERQSQMRAAHIKADKQVRAVLNDAQKANLDQMEQEAHMDVKASPK